MTNKLSIYLHIPFCERKCGYCAFYSLPSCADSLKEAYNNAVLWQIKAFGTDRIINSVYFGGGTPPVLGVGRLITLLEAIKREYTLAEDCEITLEVNPKSVTANELVALKNAGFNRLSVGMQTADDNELAALGRKGSFALFKETISSALAAGLENISADIMFGIPSQTQESLERTIMSALNTGVRHISAYSLTIEEGTPFHKNKCTLYLPDEDSEDAMYYTLCAVMREQGFKHYEISSFAKEDARSRHNLHYWDCGEYIGFGAAAHSYYGGKRFSGVADVECFIALADDDYYSPTDYKTQPLLSEAEKYAERIMLGLRTSKGIEADKRIEEKSERFVRLGYAKLENGFLSLTESGYRISNHIISELLI